MEQKITSIDEIRKEKISNKKARYKRTNWTPVCIAVCIIIALICLIGICSSPEYLPGTY